MEASTFWGACGAICRDVFLSLGGFDESYRQPSIEDIELGYRLKQAGYRIKLCKTLQVKHLKHWGVVSLLKADFFYRALAWTQLILRNGKLINDLNLQLSSRGERDVSLWAFRRQPATEEVGFTNVRSKCLLQTSAYLKRIKSLEQNIIN